MRTTSVYKAICGLTCVALALLAPVNEANADGTEQLGPPGITIAEGSEVVVAGVGLKNDQPDDITIVIPADVTISQVLLYWCGRSEADPGANDTIKVNTMDVTGPRIGGPTTESALFPTSTYRADITAMSATNDWILAGQANVLTIDELDFDYSNDGAAVVVILDDGSMTDIQILDGADWAWLGDDAQTQPVTFPVDPSEDPQIGYLWLIVSDIGVPRPAAVEITVGGVTNLLDNVLQDNEGDSIDVVELAVPLAPGDSNVTVRVLSIVGDGTLNPASLAWSFVSWELPIPVDEGCTYTKGYWKNHPDDWPEGENYILYFPEDDAMDILCTPPKKGNAWVILAHQYIAAGLNVGNGASIPDEVLDAWLKGEELLKAYAPSSGIIGTIPKKTEDRDWAIHYAGILDDYNNGYIGPGHCDDKCDH